MAEIALPGSALSAAEARYRALRAREQWRRRVPPLAGGAGFIAFRAALVALLKVPPFIAPSPLAVVAKLLAEFPRLMANLAPTAIEAISGFLIGNLAAILIATAFVHKKSLEEAFFPVVVLINTIPVVA